MRLTIKPFYTQLFNPPARKLRIEVEEFLGTFDKEMQGKAVDKYAFLLEYYFPFILYPGHKPLIAPLLYSILNLLP